MNIQNSILAGVVGMLGGVAQHNLDRERTSRKRRRSQGAREERLTKKSRPDQAVAQESLAVTDPTEVSVMESDETSPDSAAAPSILRHITVGINEVTKRLEALARSHRQTIVPSSEPPAISDTSTDLKTSSSRIVIACRADVDPPILIGHLPHLVAACNSVGKHSASKTGASIGSWLIPMSKGAENTLADAMGLRRVSVILIEVTLAYASDCVVAHRMPVGIRATIFFLNIVTSKRVPTCRTLAICTYRRTTHYPRPHTHQTAAYQCS